MPKFANLTDNTLRILISETEGALASSDVDAAANYGGVTEAFRRYGDGWRKVFEAQLVEYRAALAARVVCEEHIVASDDEVIGTIRTYADGRQTVQYHDALSAS